MQIRFWALGKGLWFLAPMISFTASLTAATFLISPNRWRKRSCHGWKNKITATSWPSPVHLDCSALPALRYTAKNCSSTNLTEILSKAYVNWPDNSFKGSSLWSFYFPLQDYCASKFGAVGFHESLTHELIAEDLNGIKTTLVCPYIVDTGMFAGCEIRWDAIIHNWSLLGGNNEVKLHFSMSFNASVLHLPGKSFAA